MSSSRLEPGEEWQFDTLTNQTLASQTYATSILLPCALGWVFQVAITGVAVAMFVGYLRTEMYERDSGARKALVWTVVAVAVAQAGMNVASICYWMVQQDRSAAALLHPTPLDAIQTLSIAINAPLVQGFLAMRAARLVTLRWAKRLILACFAILIVLEFGALIFSTVLGILFHMNRLSSGLLHAARYGLIPGVWLVLAAVTDVAISVLLVLVLRRRIAGFNASTDGRLRALSRLAVQSASYTALVAFLGFIFTFATPFNNLLWSSAPYASWWLLSACYALALLTTLSSRALILRKNSAPPPASLPGPLSMSEQQQSPRTAGMPGRRASGKGRSVGLASGGAGSRSGSGSGSGSGSAAGTSRTVGERILGLGLGGGSSGGAGAARYGTPRSSSAGTTSASASKQGSPLPPHVGGAGVTHSGIQVDQEVSVHVDDEDDDIDDALVGLGFEAEPRRASALRTPRKQSVEASPC